MSRPRAATSVATSAMMRLSLKSSSALHARVLALVAVDGQAADAGALELLARRLAPCLVRVNTSTWCQLPSLIRCASRWRL